MDRQTDEIDKKGEKSEDRQRKKLQKWKRRKDFSSGCAHSLMRARVRAQECETQSDV